MKTKWCAFESEPIFGFTHPIGIYENELTFIFKSIKDGFTPLDEQSTPNKIVLMKDYRPMKIHMFLYKVEYFDD